MSYAECPRCGEPIPAGSPGPGEVSGDNFCKKCYEPLFWRPARLVTPDAPRVDGDGPDSVVATLATRPASQGVDGRWPYDRYPEKEGIEATSYKECWNCRERHDEAPHGESFKCSVCGVKNPKPPREPTRLVATRSDRDESEALAPVSWNVPDWVLQGLGGTLAVLLVLLLIAL
ncbi:MAG: hypothetical protein AB8G26_10155 [Ilumatobacter sp.]